MRLDNVAFRLGLAPTRRAARQMVSHGHLLVNGTRVTIPSYRVSEGDTVTIRDRSKDTGLFTELTETLAARPSLSWATFNSKKMEGSITSAPNRDAIDTSVDLGVVMEYYSRR